MATGSPFSFANCTTSSAPPTGSAVPGTCGAPARCAMCRALTLSPRLSMAAGGGPIQTRPASITACAKCAFSERNPYPGWTPSAPARRATSRSLSTAR